MLMRFNLKTFKNRKTFLKYSLVIQAIHLCYLCTSGLAVAQEIGHPLIESSVVQSLASAACQGVRGQVAEPQQPLLSSVCVCEWVNFSCVVKHFE